jgi:phospholipid/cholesterol/gamma-HCH transport system substrate-binding protein
MRSTSANLAALSADFQQTGARLDSLILKMNQGSGSVGLALNDPGAYNDLRGVLQRMDSLLADVKRDPRRYINLKVF